MGMYTHVRGWLRIAEIDFSKEQFDEVMSLAEGLSPRVDQCVASTVFHRGFNYCPYVFIGGEIKDYDDDWETFIAFLRSNLPIEDERLEMQYEQEGRSGTLGATEYSH